MPNLLDEKIFANALAQIEGLGPVRLSQLRAYFGSWSQAWRASSDDLIGSGLPAKIISQIISDRNKINPENSFADLTRRQIEVVLDTETDYPQLLKEIASSPPLLYVRGNKKVLNAPGIGVVGTRKISAYGKQVCQEIASGLTQSNLAIVSGLAFGVDAEVLSATVEQGGQAIAVLASDLDNNSISPRSNFQLAQKIMKEGCLVSEYPLGAAVGKTNFPVRNRIISGMSLGTIVVEADLESGSLITANFALEQNREVFAVPGSIFSQTSRGTNELLRKGAHVVTSVGSILDELNLTQETLAETVDMEATEEETLILSKLSRDPVNIDDLIRKIQLPVAQVSASLSVLEMKGRIKNLGGAKYVKIR